MNQVIHRRPPRAARYRPLTRSRRPAGRTRRGFGDRLAPSKALDSHAQNINQLRNYSNSKKHHDCDVKDMGQLKADTQKRLKSLGVKSKEFDSLTNRQKLGLLNIMGSMADAGLSLKEFSVARKGGKLKLNRERVYFTAKNKGALPRMEAALKRKKFQKNRLKEHKGMRESYRQPRAKRSLQVGLGKDGRTLEIDIDPNNPQKGPVPFLKHTFDVLFKGKTNPYNVANRRFWECEGHHHHGVKRF